MCTTLDKITMIQQDSALDKITLITVIQHVLDFEHVNSSFGLASLRFKGFAKSWDDVRAWIVRLFR